MEVIVSLSFVVLVSGVAPGAASEKTPLYQSTSSGRSASPEPLTLRDSSRDDRWLGVPVRDVRWSPDGKAVYFRWHPSPSPSDVPDADPWYRVDRSGASAERVPEEEVHAIPAESPSWSRDGSRACWARKESLYLYEAQTGKTTQVLSLSAPVLEARLLPDGGACDFLIEEDLHRYDVTARSLRKLTRKSVKSDGKRTNSEGWREKEEATLFARIREGKDRESRARAYRRSVEPSAPQVIEVEAGVTLEDVRMSPDGRFVTFRTRKTPPERRETKYVDYVTRTGDSEVREARPKVGDLEDESRLGILRFDPKSDPDEALTTWVDLSAFGPDPAVVYGPYWSLEGARALVQIVSTGHKDRFLAELDVETGRTTVLVHDRDEAWLGGPPPVEGYLEPALLEWIPGGRFVFASERTGWSHLYLVEPGREPRALTQGEWEVRDAKLSRDRALWLLVASREHLPTIICIPFLPREESSRG